METSTNDVLLLNCRQTLQKFEDEAALTSSNLPLARKLLEDLVEFRLNNEAAFPPLAKEYCAALDAPGELYSSPRKKKQNAMQKLFSALLRPCAAPSSSSSLGSGAEIGKRLELLEIEIRRAKSATAISIIIAPSSAFPVEDGNDVDLHSISTSPIINVTGCLRKPSRQETVTSMAYVQGGLVENGSWKSPRGRIWLYINRLFGADKLLTYDLSSGVEQQAEGIKAEGPVTAMHLDSRGVMWSGHRSGAVIAWKEDEKKILAVAARASSFPVKAITTDEADMVWIGSDRGDVRRMGLVMHAADGGYEVQLHRHLRHTGAGVQERSATADIDLTTQMVKSLRAKEKAHEGAVTSLAAAAGRVWTAGGSAAFLCLREWTQRGEFLKKHDLKSIGAAVSMLLVSPLVRVNTAPDLSSSLGSALSESSVNSLVFKNTELPQSWQLLTGHGSGVVQVWGDVRGMLCPLLRITGGTSPITSLSIHSPLGLICTSHLDGQLVVQAVPHPNGLSALSVTLMDGSISSVKLRNRGEIKVAESGIATMDGGPAGILTAAHDASILFTPASALQKAAEEGGIAVAEPSSLQDQWPLHVLTPQDVQIALPSFINRPVSTSGGGGGGLKFSEDASRWQIEYSDLTQTRVIGEGAFGKVYLGRWHETDVAIKYLASLSALGLPSETSVNDVEAIKTLEREVGLMVNMRHPNVILFMGLCPEPPCIVTEYCSRGSLYDLLQAARQDEALAQQLSWSKRLGLALDAAKGMLYLHSHKPPIIHRDLKSPNLLVDFHWRAKVTDFNLSRLSEAPSVASSLAANNPRWQSPEVIHSRNFSASADVYAFALIMWELATWELPFEKLTQYQIMLAVGEKAGRPDIPLAGSSTLRGGSFSGYAEYVVLMEACWAQDPAARPGFDHIIAVLRNIAAKLGSTASTSQKIEEAEGAAVPPTPTPSEMMQQQPVAHVLQQEPQLFASPFESTLPTTTLPPPSPFASPFDMPMYNQQPVAAVAAVACTTAPSSSPKPVQLRMIDSANDSFGGHIPSNKSSSGAGKSA